MHAFEPFPKLQPFEDLFCYPIGSKVHAIIYDVGDIVEGRFVELFPKYWTKSHFLMGSIVYVYPEEDLSGEALY